MQRISLVTAAAAVASTLAHLAARASGSAPAARPADMQKSRLRVIEKYLSPAVDPDAPRAEDLATDIAELVQREVGEITGLADHLYGMADLDCREADLSGEPYLRLDDLRWLLAGYVLRGNRIRRMIQLPALIGALPASRDTETVCETVRSTAIRLLERIRSTNNVVADWLLMHRVALPDPDLLDSNALFDRYSRMQIEPCSVSADPLYLLTCHLHDALEIADAVDDPDHPGLRVLEAQLGKPLAAIDEEITAVLTFNAALTTLACSLRPAPTDA